MADSSPDSYQGGVAAIVEREPSAGTVTELFLPSYIPISGVDGLDNFCDIRPGDLTGCVSFWAYDAGAAGPPLWNSIPQMLQTIESYITEGPPQGWSIVVEDGAMHWEVEARSYSSTSVPQGPAPVPAESTGPVTPTWPDIPQDLPENAIKALRAHHVPRDQSVDLIAVQQSVIDDALRKYKGPVTGVRTHGINGGYSLPRIPGATLSVIVVIGGLRKLYTATATATDSVGGYTIKDEHHNLT